MTEPLVTVAARIPGDLKTDLETLAQRAGTNDLSVVIRRLLREGVDAELAAGQGRLFDAAAGAARKTDPQTSKDATLDVAPRSGSQRRRALERFAKAADEPYISGPGISIITGTRVDDGQRVTTGGLTADDVIALEQVINPKVAVNGLARRVTDLKDAGAVTEVISPTSGKVLTRLTRNDSQAEVLRITAKGRRWLAEVEAAELDKATA